MDAIAKSNVADIHALFDPAPDLVRQATEIAPSAIPKASFDDLLDMDLDGIVIATPSALHAKQAIAALERGMAVFCQKPLGRNTAENRAVIDAARAANRLLGVDLCYRFLTPVRQIHDLVRRGSLGKIYAVEMVFHNAYGPDKAWFYDASLSGGGCVIDLGIHLVDLALWILGFPPAKIASSRLLAKGQPRRGSCVEDYATARIDLESGTTIQMACSWNLPAGCDAMIGAAFYGTEGGASFHNVEGSFYNFAAERFHGTKREQLFSPPEAWGGRAAARWAERLAAGERYDPEIENLLPVAALLDDIYHENAP
jgi:predicted dehydrogenase